MATRWLTVFAVLLSSIAIAPAEDAPAPLDPKALLTRSLEAYRSLDTYYAKESFGWHTEIKVGEEEPETQGQEVTGEITFQAPNRFQSLSDDVSEYANGSLFWLVNDKLKQYVETSMDADFDLKDAYASARAHQMFVGVDQAALLYRDKTLVELFPQVRSWDSAEAEERDGRAGFRIKGTLDASGIGMEGDLPWSVWIDGEDYLLRELVIDATEAYRTMMASQEDWEDEEDEAEKKTLLKSVAQVKVQALRINEPVDQALFTYSPPADFKKVESFRRPRGAMGDAEQMKLIGKPAPPFVGVDLDGNTIALTNYAGKVVLLDFWATWCGPCVAAMPHVQALWTEYESKGVVVLGMNRDRDGSERKVRRFLEAKGITFRQVMDVEGEAAQSYAVRGIPCSVLIDTRGVIQMIKTGFGPGGEEELKRKIERVLAGETLYDEAQLAAEIAALESGTSEDDLEFSSGGNNESVVDHEPLIGLVETGRLARTSRRAAEFGSYGARDQDVNGDGVVDWILPSYGRGVVVIDGATGEHQTYRFKGLGQASISGVDAVPTPNGLCWLVAMTRYKSAGSSTSEVRLYDAAGAKLWSYAPVMDASRQVDFKIAAGDLDRDGALECVIALTTYTRRSLGENSFRTENQKAYLVVLGMDGQVKCSVSAGRSIDVLRITRPPGGTSAIVAGGNNGISIYTYDPDKAEAVPAGAVP